MATQAIVGTWLGQDGRDVMGASQSAPPNDIQDIHIAFTNLPEDRNVVKVETLGYGGGRWLYTAPWGPSSPGWVQTPGATTADLYLDPYMVETGREFYVALTYDDGTSSACYLQGGTADPNLRMPYARASAQWVGQDGQDQTGPGPGVGPDGVLDVHLTLSNLSTKVGVSSVTVRSAAGAAWSSGTNPNSYWNAEFSKSAADPTKGDLYFNPISDLAGQVLTLTIGYADGRSDVTTVIAGAADPGLRVSSPSPVVVNWGTLSASWIGQDGLNLTGLGDVHIALSGLPVGRSVVSATLSNEARSNWSYQANPGSSGWVDPFASRLGFRRSSTDSSQADLSFRPMRAETGSLITVRVVLDDGSIHAVQVAGGAVDFSKLAPAPALTSLTAKPGDNLVVLVNQYGSLHLSAGVYLVNQPLLLTRPITITADPGAIIQFSQAATDPVWTTAISIEAGNTTLDGFSVRFATPIRFAVGTGTEPSVIGSITTRSPLVNLRLTHLDLMSPPPASQWEVAAHLVWLTRAQNGVIADNTLKGGMIEFNNGPWMVTGNDYRGALPNTFAFSAFSVHYTHDVLIANNRIQPVDSSGKTWRFLVMTGSGYRDVVRDNNVIGVGPMDNDTVAHPNAPEIILTESYKLHFEGAVSSISADGWIVQIPYNHSGIPTTGEVIAILSGPEAGQWRMIAQALSPTTFLLNAPMSPANRVISIASGFIQETFEGNRIDARGSSIADGMVLAGNHFGTRVINNHFIGGNNGIRMAASGSELPVMWGWSRAPVLGVIIQGNTFEDNLRGAIFDIEESIYTKRVFDRTYMTVDFVDNSLVWSEPFLAARAQARLGLPSTFEAGNSLSTDPSGLLVTARGNTFKGPANLRSTATWTIYAGTFNGQRVINQSVALLASITRTAPTGLGLVRDSGRSATDGVTNDGRLHFEAVEEAVGYEYSLTNAEGSFQPVASSDSFLPAGLGQGSNTIYVRAYDSSGNRGPSSWVIFIYDTIAPTAVSQLVAYQDGRVQFGPTGTDDVYEYRVGGSGSYQALGELTQFSTPDLLRGPRTVQVHAIDLAGNVGPGAITTILPRWIPVERDPVENPPETTPSQGQGQSPTAPQSQTPTGTAPPRIVVTTPNVRPGGVLVGLRARNGQRWLRIAALHAAQRRQAVGVQAAAAARRREVALKTVMTHPGRPGLKQRLRSLLQLKAGQRQA